MTRCRHFTGVQHKACAAGVEYATLEQPAPDEPYPGMFSLPCLRWDGAQYCQRFKAKTTEEFAAESKRFEESAARATRALQAIAACLGPHGLGSGKIECPNCGGVLSYSILDIRAMRAKCDKEGCVAMMT